MRRYVTCLTSLLAVGLLMAGCGEEPVVSPAAATGTGIAPPGVVTTDGLAVDDPTPTPVRVRYDRIVGDLWTQRQMTMETEDEKGFAAFESGPMLAHDVSAAKFVNCGCEPPRTKNPLERVTPLKSREKRPTTVFAEVRAGQQNKAATRFIVIARRVSHTWKIAFVTYDEDDEGGSKRLVTDPSKAPPKTTKADQRLGAAQFKRLAQESQRWMHTGQPMSPLFTPTVEVRARLRQGRAGSDVGRTDYGATATTKLELHARDGLYTYRLDRKRIITCGTIHSPQRYTMENDRFVQPQNKKAWGPMLKPGVYQSITLDTQSMTCLLDHGPSASPRLEVLGNFHGLVAASGKK
jgi:hypothetical protein